MSAAELDLQQQVHALYSDHRGWLHEWLRRKLGCAHHAADVVQDTFLRIIVSRDAVAVMREPRAYLTVTAKRLMVDQARRKIIEQAYLEQLALSAASADMAAYPSPEQIMVALQALEQIAMALDSLPSKAAMAFLLHYLDGWTHAAIALELGVSVRMVRKYLVQALTRCDQVPQ